MSIHDKVAFFKDDKIRLVFDVSLSVGKPMY